MFLITEPQALIAYAVKALAYSLCFLNLNATMRMTEMGVLNSYTESEELKGLTFAEAAAEWACTPTTEAVNE
jgi:hypothetical protein